MRRNRRKANNKDNCSKNDSNDYDGLYVMMIAHDVLLAQHTTLQRYVLNLQMIW